MGDKVLAARIEKSRCTELLEEIREAAGKVDKISTAANNTSRRANEAFDMSQMTIPLDQLLTALEKNRDLLDEGAKAEILKARFKFNQFREEKEAEEEDGDDW